MYLTRSQAILLGQVISADARKVRQTVSVRLDCLDPHRLDGYGVSVFEQQRGCVMSNTSDIQRYDANRDLIRAEGPLRRRVWDVCATA